MVIVWNKLVSKNDRLLNGNSLAYLFSHQGSNYLVNQLLLRSHCNATHLEYVLSSHPSLAVTLYCKFIWSRDLTICKLCLLHWSFKQKAKFMFFFFSKKNNDNENKAQKHLGVYRSNPGQEGGSSVWPVTWRVLEAAPDTPDGFWLCYL